MGESTQETQVGAVDGGPGRRGARESSDGWLEKALARVSGNLVIVSTIIGISVTISQSLTSCSQDNIQRYKSFRESVSAEEKYWETLFERLLAATEDPDDSDAVRDKKLAIIHAMSQRNVPSFSEHVLGVWRNETDPQVEANTSINGMKFRLIEALGDDRAVGIEQAGITQAAIFQSEQQALVQTREESDGTRIGGPAAAEKVQSAQAETGPTYQAQTLASGVPNGWDIDVFWCAGGDEAARFNAGRLVASALAAQAKSGYLADARSFPLGRIRLRALPVTVQALGGYPSSGNEVRGEYGANDKGEDARASALVAWLNGDGQPSSMGLDGGFRRVRSVMETPYYISVFVCSAAASA